MRQHTVRHEVQSLKQLQRPLDHLPPAAVRGVVSFAGIWALAAKDGRCGVIFGVCPILAARDQVIRKDPARRGTEKAADDLGCVVLCGCVSCSCVEI